jgi:hypothetical protein
MREIRQTKKNGKVIHPILRLSTKTNYFSFSQSAIDKLDIDTLKDGLIFFIDKGVLWFEFEPIAEDNFSVSSNRRFQSKYLSSVFMDHFKISYNSTKEFKIIANHNKYIIEMI